MTMTPLSIPDSDVSPTDVSVGLSAAEAARRLAEHGPNKLADPPTRPRWRRFVDQFRSLLVGVLAGAAVLAAVLGDLKDAVIVGVVLLINAVLGYVQEGKAEQAMTALKQMLVAHSRVRRDGQLVEVPSDDLVPGDIVLLEAGDRVPADGRFVLAAALRVDEAPLTGESVPIDKIADPNADPDDDAEASGTLTDRPDSGFMNTTVVRGRGELLVERTGMATEMGKVAALLHEAEPGPTPLQIQLDKLGKKLAAVAAVAVGVVLATRLIQGEDLAEAVLGAVALAVAAIPEGLPAVVTVTLAVGVHQMALRQAIVKRLASVETLGSTTVICSDKTGTLTRNEMRAREAVHADGIVRLDDDGHTTAELGSDVRRAIESAALCNDAALDEDGALVGDPTEGALLGLAVAVGVDPDALRRARPRLGEVPFDSAAKYMATFHRDGDDVVCIVKGAPDVVAALTVEGTDRDRWAAEQDRLAAQGMRVLAVAHRRLDAAEALAADGTVADPDRWVRDLELDLLVGIVDPPRPEARDAIALCRKAGIAVKMITGDHATTAGAIAGELGITGRVVTGAELDAMDDATLDAAIDDIGVCARVSPEHKVRIVQSLRRRGHIVAMTGDGVNDAAALRHADIGVAMGITGTEVTKEAADMVLADDNFATIVGAVERGRAIYENIVTFVRFQLTTNLGAIGTLLGASVLGLPSPLTAIQVLFINIIADGPPAMTLGVDPPKPGTMQRPPHAPGTPILDRQRIVRLCAAAIVMVAGTLGLMVWARGVWGDAVALTMAFTTFVLYQVVNVFNARTERASILHRETLTNAKLWLAVGSVVVLQVLLVSIPALQDLFVTVALSPAQWALCAATALTVLVTEELRKAVLRARAGA